MIKIEDKNRRNLPLPQSRVDEALPSYFETDNSALITALEKYYDFLDSDGQHAFSNSINEIILNRDVAQNSEEALDELITEIGDGLTSASFFKQPRLMAKLLGEFYRVKGTLVSIEGFFRGFFNEDIVVEYPKEQIFIVGESNVGFDSQRFIQDNGIYQIFSILVKSGVSISDYEALYKKFVHPAGWHFQGEVSTINEVEIIPSSLNSLDSIRPDIITFATPLLSEATIGLQSEFHEMTGLLDSNGFDVRVRLDQLVSVYQDLTSTELENFYGSLAELLTPNSFTFDDSGFNNFVYNGYPKEGISEPTNFLADSASQVNKFYIMNGPAPYNNLNHNVTTLFNTSIKVSYNQVSAFGTTPPAISALLGPPTQATIIYIQSNLMDWDPSKFVNPEHIEGLDFNIQANRSTRLPGLLIKGSALSPPQPDYYFRIDSDAYYFDDDNFAQGTFTSPLTTGARFSISRIKWQGKDSAAPDFSMNLETMDNDMFTRYTADSSI